MASGSLRGATPHDVLARRVAASAAPVPAAAAGPAASALRARPTLRRLVAALEGFAYSSGLAALVGAAMTWSVARALVAADPARDAATVACGAFVIYGLDRLRDLARDRWGSPGRTAFVLRHRPGLIAATTLGGLALGALLVAAPPAGRALCLAVGAIGLLHRRLKRDARVKVAYVAAAWTAACVGLPALDRGGDVAVDGALGFSAAFVGAGVTANLIASNLRDGKAAAAGWSPAEALPTAVAIGIAGGAAAAFAPESVAPLGWIPAAEALALVFFRGSERFGHLVVDGALLVGAVVAAAACAAG